MMRLAPELLADSRHATPPSLPTHNQQPTTNRISCLIPALNEATGIGETIAAARQAGFDEIIVVDGGSTDDTLALASAADRALTSLRGRARQQNAGAAATSADVLFFLHADCRPSVGLADAIRRVMVREDVVAGCCTQRIDAAGWGYRLLEWGNLRRVLWFGLAYGDQGLFVRRSIFEAIGGFPEWPLMEELGLKQRLHGRGRFVVLRKSLVVSPRRWQQRGIARQTLHNWWMLTRFFLGASPATLAKQYRDVR